MRTDRRPTLGPLACVAVLLGLALATSGAAARVQEQDQEQEPDRPAARQPQPGQEPAPGRRPREIPRGVPQIRDADDPDAEPAPGGLRLPPQAAPGEIPARPADDLLDQAGPAAMPADADAGRRPGAAAAAAAADPNQPIVPRWPFRYDLTIASFDGAPLAIRYYPSQLGSNAPVLLLVHDLGPGRSGADFDASITELDNLGLASHLQQQDYAVLALDLRGHGQSPNPSRARAGGGAGAGARAGGGGAGAGAGAPNPLTRRVGDLQAAYRFLLDRHNRRELNLAKFGALGLGEGANLLALWASAPGGAVSIEGRTSDLAALALVSPRPNTSGRPLEPPLSSLAPRLPLLLQAGAGDAESAALLDALRPVVERQRLSRVALAETRLSATNLLRFAPEATRPLLDFFDNTVKIRADEWEPRYNLEPVLFTNVRLTNLGDDPAPDPAPANPNPPADADADADAGAAADADAGADANAAPRRRGS